MAHVKEVVAGPGITVLTSQLESSESRATVSAVISSIGDNGGTEKFVTGAVKILAGTGITVAFNETLDTITISLT